MNKSVMVFFFVFLTTRSYPLLEIIVDKLKIDTRRGRRIPNGK